MELKDVILSTLAEMDSETSSENESQTILVETVESNSNTSSVTPKEEIVAEDDVVSEHSEQLWLQSVRERLLVLFEGFQSPNNVQIEAKVDLSLNFLEYLLANIDTRIENIKGKTD